MWAAFSATATNPAANTCAVFYSRSTNMVYLENAAGTAATSAVVGTNSTLQNTQCSINVGGTAASISGNTLSLNLAVTFASSYSGTKSIYLWAADAGGANSGWQSRGSWTIPAAAPPLSITTDSVTPNSGSGVTQTLTLQYSDSAGAGSFTIVWLAFSGTANNPSASSCALYYSRSDEHALS